MIEYVVLDLDETLVTSINDTVYSNIKSFAPINPNMIYEKEYFFYKRPYLDEFLDFIFSNFKVIIWTAAAKDYALFIIDNIIGPRKIEYILFDYHCQKCGDIYENNIKFLECISDYFNVKDFDPSKAILIDDLKERKDGQENNTYIISPPFKLSNVNDQDEFDDIMKDTELLKLVDYLKTKYQKNK